jgi:hypothetical protein
MTTAHSLSERALPTRPNFDISASRSIPFLVGFLPNLGPIDFPPIGMNLAAFTRRLIDPPGYSDCQQVYTGKRRCMTTAHSLSERALPTRPNFDDPPGGLFRAVSSDWLKCRNSVGSEGLVPTSYVREVYRTQVGEETDKKWKLTRLDDRQMLSLCDGQP